MQFTTLNSTYEVDTEHKRIRRLEGVNSPTPRQGPDGEWKQYAKLTPMVYAGRDEIEDLSFFIDWDGEGHGTLTSPIQDLDLDVEYVAAAV